MGNNNLDIEIENFVNERLEKEMYDIYKYKDNVYNFKAKKIIEDINNSLGEDNDICKLINELMELYICDIIDMMELSYRLGFKDGLNFERSMCDI